MTTRPVPSRTPGSSARAVGSAAALALAVTLAAAPPAARAQDVAGSLSAGVLVADGDVGGGATLDLWAPFDGFRVGGFLGIGVIPADRDPRNRVMMPAGVSLATHWDLGGVSLGLRARGGLWGGATQEVKLTVGGLVGGGVALGWQASAEISVFASAEFWGILGAGETWCLPLSLGIEWGPASPAPLATERSTAAPDLSGE